MHFMLGFQFECVCDSVRTCVLWCLYLLLGLIMEGKELFSLEEDDGNELFITQSANDCLMDHLEGSQLYENQGDVAMNFIEASRSVVDQVRGFPVYEDISNDDTVFECSQNQTNFE